MQPNSAYSAAIIRACRDYKVPLRTSEAMACNPPMSLAHVARISAIEGLKVRIELTVTIFTIRK